MHRFYLRNQRTVVLDMYKKCIILNNLNMLDLRFFLFQEARKILIAQYESIVINEVVPLLIGSRADSLRKVKVLLMKLILYS